MLCLITVCVSMCIQGQVSMILQFCFLRLHHCSVILSAPGWSVSSAALVFVTDLLAAQLFLGCQLSAHPPLPLKIQIKKLECQLYQEGG